LGFILMVVTARIPEDGNEWVVFFELREDPDT
jgi:hypothetical protein